MGTGQEAGAHIPAGQGRAAGAGEEEDGVSTQRGHCSKTTSRGRNCGGGLLPPGEVGTGRHTACWNTGGTCSREEAFVGI